MKRTLLPFAVLNGKAVSSTTTYIQDQGFTPYTDARYIDNLGYQFRVDSGTPTGQFYVEATNVADPNDSAKASSTAADWVDLGLSGLSIASGVFAGSVASALASLNQLPFAFVRVKYVNASGSGVVSAFVSGKEV